MDKRFKKNRRIIGTRKLNDPKDVKQPVSQRQVEKVSRQVVQRSLRKATDVKFVIIGIDGLVDTSGSTLELTQYIEKGADARKQRTGASIRLIGIQLHVASGAGDNFNHILHRLFRYDGTEAITGIFGQIGADVGTLTDQTLKPNNEDKIDAVYLNKRLYCNYQSGGVIADRIPTLNKFLKMNMNLNYSADTGAAHNHRIYYSTVSDSSLSSHPANTGFIKLFFTDKI